MTAFRHLRTPAPKTTPVITMNDILLRSASRGAAWRADCFSRPRLILACLFMLGAAHDSQAQTVGTGGISNAPLGGGLFAYTLTLNNTGSTPIETFWYSWVPGYNLMASTPSNIGSPTGWSGQSTNNSPSDGFGVQWKTTTAPLASGSSLIYSFDSAVTPPEMAAQSTIDPIPVETAVLYSGAPFSGTSDQFVLQNVPEPPALSLLFAGGLGIFFLGWRRCVSVFRK
jgi:hypothetical protein